MIEHGKRVVSGAAIKAIRDANGLSVRDLAARTESAGAKIDAASLSRFETGKRAPSEAQAQVIADALRVPLAAISSTARIVVVIPETDAA